LALLGLDLNIGSHFGHNGGHDANHREHFGNHIDGHLGHDDGSSRWRAYVAFRMNAYMDGNPFHESVFGGCDDGVIGVLF
jgi:hypothetical protein